MAASRSAMTPLVASAYVTMKRSGSNAERGLNHALISTQGANSFVVCTRSTRHPVVVGDRRMPTVPMGMFALPPSDGRAAVGLANTSGQLPKMSTSSSAPPLQRGMATDGEVSSPFWSVKFWRGSVAPHAAALGAGVPAAHGTSALLWHCWPASSAPVHGVPSATPLSSPAVSTIHDTLLSTRDAISGSAVRQPPGGPMEKTPTSTGSPSVPSTVTGAPRSPTQAPTFPRHPPMHSMSLPEKMLSLHPTQGLLPSERRSNTP
mmetsp:Transcript_7254/g.29565  ORF Transcript_7254/g.29565 Transcript_7254/m.29565 type:complete len:262 (-) Transcript_7254:292-1077(-)